MLKIGLVGYGYWGPNLLRNFMMLQDACITRVSDVRPERLASIKSVYPSISLSTDPNELINDTSLDAVVIATPVHTHFPLAMQALQNGKHVLLEKPMAASRAEAEKLHELALQKKLTLMVDHTFLYTGAVQKMKELMVEHTIGIPLYFDSTRFNLGLFQPDINVLWDLAPHDLSILLHLTGKQPSGINATGISHTNNGIENIGYLTLNYDSGFIAHFSCSWSSPVKVRSMLLGGDKKMIYYNDLEPTEKVKVYDTGYKHETDEEKKQILVDYRTGDIFIPKISTKEGLTGVAEDFIHSITSNHQPLANSKLGCDVVKILEAAQVSIRNDGKAVKIDY